MLTPKQWTVCTILHPSTAIHCQVKGSPPTANNPVVVLGTPMQTGTTKLSVISQEDVASVHLNFLSANSCFANCKNGDSALQG